MIGTDSGATSVALDEGHLVAVLSDTWPHVDGFLTAVADEPGFVGVRIPTIRDTVRSYIDRFQPSILLLHDELWTELAGGNTSEKWNADMKIVVFDDGDHGRIKDLIHRGCAGVIPPDASADLALRVMKAVAMGEIWVPRVVLADIVRALVAVGRGNELTKREVEILGLVIEGKKNSEIADALFISRETVRWHLRRIYAKRGIQGRKDARRMSSFQNWSA